MGIVEGIKDTARKATNSVVDTTEGIIGMPKSPKELAKRLIEHLNHQEYSKIAEIITDEAKKYVAKMGIENVAIVNKKLEDFEEKLTDLAENFEAGNYKQIATKLKEFERLVPEEVGPVSEVFKTIKSLLRKMVSAVEEYAKEGEKGLKNKEPDFSKLQDEFEGYFKKITPK